MIRAALLRWLDVPSRNETVAIAKAVAVAEIDADQAWKTGPHESGNRAVRRSLRVDREIAIADGRRENPGA